MGLGPDVHMPDGSPAAVSRGRLLTLTTDFGYSDSYVAEMKGVISCLAPGISVLDLSHAIEPCNVTEGARFFERVAPLFPEDTVHLGVIDPEVGSPRRRIIVEAAIYNPVCERNCRAFFIGPDNGLFSLVAPQACRTAVWEIRELKGLTLAGSARTFDGRNIFAPVAARLARGEIPAVFGPQIESLGGPAAIEELDSPRQRLDLNLDIIGRIIRFDRFGNAETDIVASELGSSSFILLVDETGLELSPASNYSEIEEGQAAVLVSSAGFLEIAANKRSARDLLSLRKGMPVRVVLL